MGSNLSEDHSSQSRRAFIADVSLDLALVFAGSAALLSGCSKRSNPPPTMTTQERAQFNHWVEQLQVNYHVREYKALGPIAVVVFTDAHREADSKKTDQRVAEVDQILNFEVMGFEGEHGDMDAPQSPEAEALQSKEIREIFEARPELLISPDELRAMGLEVNDRPTVYGHHTQIKGPGNAKKIGLESPNETVTEMVMLEQLSLFYGDLRSGVFDHGYYILGADGRWGIHTHAFMNAQLWCAAKYPDFPVLDLSAFHYELIHDDDHFAAAIKNDEKLVVDAHAAYDNWLREHKIYVRNQDAAIIMADYLEQNGLTRGAVVFGLLHSVTAGANQISIQDHLASRNISYIVIDPVKVEIKRTNEAVHVIMGKE